MQDREIREHNARAWLAYHVAGLSRVQKMPKLEKLQMAAPSNRRRRQSWQEQMAIMSQWIAVTHRIETNKKATG